MCSGMGCVLRGVAGVAGGGAGWRCRVAARGWRGGRGGRRPGARQSHASTCAHRPRAARAAGVRCPPRHPRPLNPTRSIFPQDYYSSCNNLRKTIFGLHPY
ncbi:unnamed protein product [Spodoptera exigua]|nr:unnamed protein product [Spodoptera exigua]